MSIIQDSLNGQTQISLLPHGVDFDKQLARISSRRSEFTLNRNIEKYLSYLFQKGKTRLKNRKSDKEISVSILIHCLS